MCYKKSKKCSVTVFVAKSVSEKYEVKSHEFKYKKRRLTENALVDIVLALLFHMQFT